MDPDLNRSTPNIKTVWLIHPVNGQYVIMSGGYSFADYDENQYGITLRIRDSKWITIPWGNIKAIE